MVSGCGNDAIKCAQRFYKFKWLKVKFGDLGYFE